jgi:riboflavin synthase
VTTLDDLAPGRQLNVEIDVLARYLGRMLDMRA